MSLNNEDNTTNLIGYGSSRSTSTASILNPISLISPTNREVSEEIYHFILVRVSLLGLAIYLVVAI